MIKSGTLVISSILVASLMLGLTPVVAGERKALACEISDTVGFQFENGKWRPVVFPAGDFFLGNQKNFILGIQDNKITQESANPLMGTHFAECHERKDVNMTFCNSPIGDSLIYSLEENRGSISQSSDITGLNKYPQGRPANKLHISIFTCKPF